MRRKTDYRSRLKLLKSGKNRIVVRKSLNIIVSQIIKYVPEGDIIIAEKTSKDLKKYGWKGHTGNLPAAYLTGFLMGKESIKNKINEAIIDFGRQIITKGCALHAFSKGIKDSGVSISIDEKALPTEERMRGKHIESYRKIDTEKNFEETKKKISESYGK